LSERCDSSAAGLICESFSSLRPIRISEILFRFAALLEDVAIN